MGGQGLGDRQDQTIGGRRKASEIEKKHAIGASPRAGTSTPGMRQLVARTLQQVEGSLTTGGYSIGGRSLGDRQDRIIGGFHHGGTLALREPRKSRLSPKFEFLRRGKAIMFSGRYATCQGTYEVVTLVCSVVIPSLGDSRRTTTCVASTLELNNGFSPFPHCARFSSWLFC
jgi:hypothetical protein